ncbi:nucleosome assembly protein, putative [Ichthyophthirius multifiliis]|uniref:Nucleosome assembly protein, putative n=1 Tax=Ichthyophthirius multifiliis TaxID=5932 RepID=G0QPJ9_ICHMU|nr:nucleosome assembly protein, putative [Ichthyophthirius multifiliis]EGR32850.1 nucleosome assembly protein, putative [Ichthyophthirius multifiliis]|eukprot:XP_004036836.1 nucleosome assembly protein, putative [Ichthyophthirius multifiliis]
MSAQEAAAEQKDNESIEKTVEEQIEEALKELPLGEKVRAVAINAHLQEKKTLDAELQKKLQQLKFEYEQLSKPIYVRTQQLVEGAIPTDEELSNLQKYLKEGENDKLDEEKSQAKPLNEYWLKAMWENDILAVEIKEQDAEPLKSLLKIEYNPISTTLVEVIFTFGPNDYFTNTVLKKIVELDEDDEPVKTTGTKIEWKEGKNTTIKITKKTQKIKKLGAKRVVEKETKVESFFNFFDDSEPLKDQDKEDAEEDQDFDNDRLNIDFDIFKTLVDEIIPYSLEYYLGVQKGGYDDEDQDEGESEEQEAPLAGKQKRKGSGSSGGKK